MDSLGQTLSAGNYNVTATGLAINGASGYGDYQFTFTLRAINAVPEPATLALFGIGLAGLGFARRRKLN